MTLTQEQIKINNEKLAKAIGWYQLEEYKRPFDSWYVNDEFASRVAYSTHNNYPHYDLPFHRDWNYLMQVVDHLGYLIYGKDWKVDYSYIEVFSRMYNIYVMQNNSCDIMINLMNNIESIWLVCVNYIDWIEKEL
jgi:hypothetical protein